MLTIGTCSVCGGPVQVPTAWLSTIPPVPRCQSCGATPSRPYGPIVPMVPKPDTERKFADAYEIEAAQIAKKIEDASRALAELQETIAKLKEAK